MQGVGLHQYRTSGKMCKPSSTPEPGKTGCTAMDRSPEYNMHNFKCSLHLNVFSTVKACLAAGPVGALHGAFEDKNIFSRAFFRRFPHFFTIISLRAAKNLRIMSNHAPAAHVHGTLTVISRARTGPLRDSVHRRGESRLAGKPPGSPVAFSARAAILCRYRLRGRFSAQTPAFPGTIYLTESMRMCSHV